MRHLSNTLRRLQGEAIKRGVDLTPRPRAGDPPGHFPHVEAKRARADAVA